MGHLLLIVLSLIGAGAVIYLTLKRTRDGVQFSLPGVGVALGILALGIFLSTTIVEVPGGHAAVITAGGKYTNNVLLSGWNFKAPWYGAHLVDTSVRALHVGKSDVFTSDNQHAYTDYTLNFSLPTDQLPCILNHYQDEVTERIVQPRAEFWLKDIEPTKSASQLIQSRVIVAREVQKHLEQDLQHQICPIEVNGFVITNISFGEQYQEASEKLGAVQQDLQREKIELEIKQVQAQQVVAAAHGQAQANALIRSSLPQNPEEADAVVRMRMVDLLNAKWNGTFPAALGGSSLLNIGNSGGPTQNEATRP